MSVGRATAGFVLEEGGGVEVEWWRGPQHSVLGNPSGSWESDLLELSPLQLSAARRRKIGERFALVLAYAVGNCGMFCRRRHRSVADFRLIEDFNLARGCVLCTFGSGG